jgi:hypothetical protein
VASVSDRISPEEVAAIQTDAVAQLLDTGRILRYSKESDGAGGQDETWTPGPELSCSIAPIGRTGGAAGTPGARLNEASTHITAWPAGTEVSAADRAEVNGVTYSITALREFGALNATRRVEVKAL